jgi:hypothetical protein
MMVSVNTGARGGATATAAGSAVAVSMYQREDEMRTEKSSNLKSNN